MSSAEAVRDTKPATHLPPGIASRLRLPLIAAPMLNISGPDLVIAACRAGIIGAFPTLNPRMVNAPGGLDAWLDRISRELGSDGQPHAPMCPNIVMRNDDLAAHVKSVIAHKAEMVITSVGSPKPILPALHDAGIFVLADVATIRHAEKALAAGVDGLVLLTAGAGGHTGWLNPFAYVRAIRKMFDGPIVLAGGIIDGVALRAAQTLGCDLAYMGTKFIATRESMATPRYREFLVNASMDDVMLTKAFTGLQANMLRPTIEAAGIDPATLDESVSWEEARRRYGSRTSGPKRWQDILAAGHTVSGIDRVLSVAELVAQTEREYRGARN
ncbi:MAG TPA: nitronate monooxygenase [Nevskiaceae bacterium]|nr:nitronate monooxygenase [Nevskiaceae bacterium]